MLKKNKFMTVVADFCIVLYKTNRQNTIKCFEHSPVFCYLFTEVHGLRKTKLYRSTTACVHRLVRVVSHADTASIDAARFNLLDKLPLK